MKRKFIKNFMIKFKTAYFRNMDAIRLRYDSSIFAHEVLVLEEVAKEVFNMSELKVKELETNWREEYFRVTNI